MAIKYPYQRMKYDDYRHIVAFKPNGCIQIDYFDLGTKIPVIYRLYRYYLIGTDVYSRYSCYYIDKDQTQMGKGNIGKNFISLIDEFNYYKLPEMVTTDSEFNIKSIRDFCKEHKIKFAPLQPGEVNANNIVERAIGSIKKILTQYLIYYNDKLEKRIEDKIDPYEHSVRVMNAVFYFYNRRFQHMVKGIPIEIYAGIESPQLPLTNYTQYPKFKIGQKVLLRPRGRYKSLTFQVRTLKQGIPGKIIAVPKPNTYTIKTINNQEINAKWYEFIPLTEEMYNKITNIPLFNL